MRYDAVLFDIDDTLLDFQEAERRALKKTLAHYALNTPTAQQAYHACNDACWRALERGELDMQTLKYKRFRDFLFAMNRADDPVAVGDHYIRALSQEGVLLPGALEAVKAVAAQVPVAAVTNGITFIQHGRLDTSPIRPYLKAVVISEEVGCAKPNPRIVHEALKQLGGVSPTRALMVGDSLASDIACARNAGVDACWYNPQGKPKPEGLPIAWEIRDLAQVAAIVAG